ncbi:MAG: helix-turn-helix domain-containing protein [Anaerolineae bacterium]|nr:helix-turn-helix domain-containing protein [Anaerolineae bacterium]
MPIRLEGMTLYTVKDIELLLGIGNSTVRRYISDGRLKGRKMARRWYVPAESLLEYFQETDQEPPAALFEKLKQLEESLDQAPAVPSLSLPKMSKNAAPAKAPNMPDPAPKEQVEDLSELDQLIRKAKRLKTEAVRIEQKYSKSTIILDEEI